MDPSSSLRQAVVAAAQRFKSGWAELGRLLTRVRDEGLFKEWGYSTFDAYCTQEVHIRRGTAEKLTRSFSFLARHEPRALEGQSVSQAPPFEVVEVLANAEDRGQLSPREYRDIRDSIWAADRPVLELKRAVEERFPRPPPPPTPEHLQLRRLATLARRLAGDLRGCRTVPRNVVEQAAAVADRVEEMVQSTKDSVRPDQRATRG